jgi:tetratricopeptide (TPR) repeat protein
LTGDDESAAALANQAGADTFARYLAAARATRGLSLSDAAWATVRDVEIDVLQNGRRTPADLASARGVILRMEEQHRRGAALNPHLPQSHVQIALTHSVVLWLQQDYVAARRLLEGALRDHPQQALLHSNSGLVYLALGENERAETALERAIALGARDSEIRAGLAVARYRLSKPDPTLVHDLNQMAFDTHGPDDLILSRLWRRADAEDFVEAARHARSGQ